jgi:trans-AT polyketide synthase, acyltransferase and oxidoreductase domains
MSKESDHLDDIYGVEKSASALPSPSLAISISPRSLGSASFRKNHGIKYAYLSGAMYKGIASKELVVAMGQAGLMGYLGTGGLALDVIESAIRHIQTHLAQGQAYGMNLLSSPDQPELESQTVDLYLKHGVRRVEAAAYMQISPSLVRYRLKGAKRTPQGRIDCPHHVLAKVSRPEVAEQFMRPAPAAIVAKLLEAGLLTTEEAELAPLVPMAQDICVEADSGGHTDQGVAYALMPAMLRLRDDIVREIGYADPIHIGAAGGIGTPQAAAAAFILGADFVMTGSINQCTVEAGTSDAAKDMLQDMNVQDTDYAPAGDMFELGAKVQVLKKGLFFAARANKLYELYMRHNSLDEIDAKTRAQIEQRYFKRSFDEVWTETKAYYQRAHPSVIDALEKNPKKKMALIFKWYFVHSTRLAMRGSEDQRVDYQVQCGPALGAFNQWVKGTELENWRQRKVADIAERIMQGTAELLQTRFAALTCE